MKEFFFLGLLCCVGLVTDVAAQDTLATRSITRDISPNSAVMAYERGVNREDRLEFMQARSDTAAFHYVEETYFPHLIQAVGIYIPNSKSARVQLGGYFFGLCVSEVDSAGVRIRLRIPDIAPSDSARFSFFP